MPSHALAPPAPPTAGRRHPRRTRATLQSTLRALSKPGGVISSIRNPAPPRQAPPTAALATQRATRHPVAAAAAAAQGRPAGGDDDDGEDEDTDESSPPSPPPSFSSTAALAAECGAALAAVVAVAALPFLPPSAAQAAADSAAAAALATTLLRPAFALAELAFVVRIIMTWYPGLDGGALPWAVAFKPTEPLLAPTRRAVPPVGGVDVAPIIWFAVTSLMNEILVGPQGILVLLSRKVGG